MCEVLCLELLRIERSKSQDLCPRGACVSGEGCKSECMGSNRPWAV